jgi:hypothetical protein
MQSASGVRSIGDQKKSKQFRIGRRIRNPGNGILVPRIGQAITEYHKPIRVIPCGRGTQQEELKQ